ncbi:SCO family protein [Burkholderia glumae]|nr:SCO1/SenC family protein [Burkholderia glumae BGR1]AJY66115.1 redoxin family protein [Burkholderia glumae LMG 2196 = ATCC 33617]PJO24495.1 SCO family protein [Burkholderia glumae AU6208]PNL00378.1 SCO family protein [Burkholderia glumae]QGA36563.1 redoxin domain-containing protein [Burkholderia glumae]
MMPRPIPSTRRRWLAACAAAGALLLGGCSRQPAFENLDITGNTQFGQDFALPDTTGRTRTLADYKGRAVVLVFGYTHCPDVCPTTLAELAQARQQLGAEGKRVQVLLVTVDPERDTAPLIAQYVAAFDPSFVALRPAGEAQLKQVAKDFRIYYAKSPGKTPDGYTMDHTAASYVFDPAGKLRLFVRDGQGPAPWVHDLRLLLG